MLSGDNHETHETRHEKEGRRATVIASLTIVGQMKDRDGIIFRVRVIPRSSRNEISGEFEGCVKVKLTAAPVDGKANADLVKMLAKRLGVARSDVEIVGGATSKTKLLKVTGVTAEELKTALGATFPA